MRHRSMGVHVKETGTQAGGFVSELPDGVHVTGGVPEPSSGHDPAAQDPIGQDSSAPDIGSDKVRYDALP